MDTKWRMSGLQWTQTAGTDPVQVSVNDVHVMDYDTTFVKFYDPFQMVSTTTGAVTASDVTYVKLYHNSSNNMICFKNSAGVETCISTTGPQGSQGPAGSQGPQGAQGPPGAQGGVGAQGSQGSQGPPGAQGSQGPQGTTAAVQDFIYAYDTTTQGISSGSTFQNVTMNTNATINGWTHTAGSADFTCPTTGTYLVTYRCNITFSAGISLTTVTGSARLTVNGTEVSGSQSSVQFPIQALSTASAPCISTQQLSLTAGNVLRLQGACSSAAADIAPNGIGTGVSAALSVIRLT